MYFFLMHLALGKVSWDRVASLLKHTKARKLNTLTGATLVCQTSSFIDLHSVAY